eukprot:m.162640 g.162640  ORF g.162640 m.162640 type:complete len:66 (-) comp12221_c0_seq1:49-246(-)
MTWREVYECVCVCLVEHEHDMGNTHPHSHLLGTSVTTMLFMNSLTGNIVIYEHALHTTLLQSRSL